jgi:Uma2 family endonuclease
MVNTWTTITDDELMQLSSHNPEMRFERGADGKLVAMTPTGGISGNREAKAAAYLLIYVESQELGEVFSSSTGFRLPNGAIRSSFGGAVRTPDAAFVAKAQLPEGWDQEDDRFLPLAPDFVIEIRSQSDSLETLQAKMHEYIANGVRLGWLVDRQNQQVWVYRTDGSVTQYPSTVRLSGEDVVEGFLLEAKKIL